MAKRPTSDIMRLTVRERILPVLRRQRHRLAASDKMIAVRLTQVGRDALAES